MRSRTIPLVAMVAILLSVGLRAQVHDVLCSDGNGSFEAEFHTGVHVYVGPTRNGLLAARSCQGSLAWHNQKIEVASEASEVDLDMFGTDLEGYGPVAAFQIRQSAKDCCRTYQIFSLEQPPRLLRTITGGDFFSGADTDLDDRVEIWAGDAMSVRGFEALVASELEFPPTLVLRVEKGQLHDVSAQFAPFYDQIVAKAKSEIDDGLLRAFKASDGRLLVSSGTPLEEMGRLRRLRGVKVRVLEIAWAYLYSGRETEAWQTLEEMWPSPDLERIRSGIVWARSHGILTQVDPDLRRPAKKQKARIYLQSEVVRPLAILMRMYPPGGAMAMNGDETHVTVVIDRAGKVRSIEGGGKGESAATIANSISEWKFVPGFRDTRAVASRVGMRVWLQR
jgi:hypothetical protein